MSAFLAWIKGIFSAKKVVIQPTPVQNTTSAPLPTVKPPAPATTEEPVLRGSLEWYGHNYSDAKLALGPQKDPILTKACDDILKNKNRYQTIERSTNVPWYLIGALHCRESSLDFSTYLGNGDPLGRRTTHIPAGRGPFSSWESGAVDALEYDGLAGRTNWTLPICLMLAEKFNGLGYLKTHTSVMSPYLWSYTNLYTKGKYSSDGHFDSELVDQQPGVAAIFKELQVRGQI